MRPSSSKLCLQLLGSFVLSLSILVNPVLAYAHGDEHHESASQEEKIKTPEKAEDIWKAIDSEIVELKKSIDNNKLDQVHHHAFTISKLVKTLPEHSPMLSADQLKTVTDNVKFVETLAKRLDESGDKNDKAATQTNLNKLIKLLDTLRKLYPSNAASIAQ